MSSLVKGTFILTIATIISKVLGFIYVVPFTALVGTQGYILFEYAYKPYVIILSFATLGVPLAVSKFVSKYNELGDYNTGQRLFKSGLTVLTITGIICFFILYSFAPTIAHSLVGNNDTTGNSLEDIIYVIRMVSFALIIVPPMAIARGFYQGHNSMEPTAISQVVEQLVRILFIIAGAFISIYIFKKSTSFAVGLATFGAFIGAVGGCIVLLWYFKKSSGMLREQSQKSISKEKVPLSKMYKELISYAIPFVIVGLAIPVFQTIDTFTINQAMMKTGINQLEAETVNSVVALVQKIIQIPVSLATALGLTLVPAVTKSFVANDKEALKGQISKTFSIIFYLTVPCVVLLMALSRPAFSFLFGSQQEVLGGQLMLWHSPTAILFSLFIVTSSILQGVNKQKFAVISLLVGIIVKLLINATLVFKFGGIGSALSSDLGFLISIGINIYGLKKYCEFKLSSTYNLISKITVISILMGFIVYLFDNLTYKFIDNLISSNFIETGIRLTLWGLIGLLFYCFASYKNKVMEEAIGNQLVDKLSKKIKKGN